MFAEITLTALVAVVAIAFLATLFMAVKFGAAIAGSADTAPQKILQLIFLSIGTVLALCALFILLVLVGIRLGCAGMSNEFCR